MQWPIESKEVVSLFKVGRWQDTILSRFREGDEVFYERYGQIHAARIVKMRYKIRKLDTFSSPSIEMSWGYDIVTDEDGDKKRSYFGDYLEVNHETGLASGNITHVFGKYEELKRFLLRKKMPKQKLKAVVRFNKIGSDIYHVGRETPSRVWEAEYDEAKDYHSILVCNLTVNGSSIGNVFTSKRAAMRAMFKRFETKGGK